LLRVVLSEDRLVPDPEARLPGRGAYLCPRPECMRAAMRKHGFERAFRAPVRVSDESLDWVS